MKHIRSPPTCLESQVAFCCLSVKKSPITHDNSHISIETQEQTYQTHSRHHTQALARAFDLQSTLHLRITLKLQKQSCLCSLSAIFHFPQALLPKPVHTHSLAYMQANHDLKPDL